MCLMVENADVMRPHKDEIYHRALYIHTLVKHRIYIFILHTSVFFGGYNHF